MSSRSFSRPASFASSTRSFIVSSVTKFLEKSKRVSEPSTSFLKVWLNFSKRYNVLDKLLDHDNKSYLRVFLEVLLQDNVLSELLVMVLESRPGG
jgi:F0F1-type ATP synthase delta subunit